MKVRGEVKKEEQIFSFTGISLLFCSIYIAGAIFSVSCTKINEFTIGQDFVEPQTKLMIVDTFKVDLSTVLVDSIPTSSTENAMVGSYRDDQFGSLKCESYFDLAFQTFDNLEENAVFDSAAFILPYSGISYGDTASLMSLAIHQLTEQIVPFSNTGLYNNSSFDYSPEPLGSVQFYPSPKSLSDTVVRVSVLQFGEELFGMIKSKNENVSTEEAFSDLLKGFVITSSDDNNKAVVGFVANKARLKLKFYYHLNKEIPEDKEINLTMGATNHQFNNVRKDFTGTLLEPLQGGTNHVKSQETGNLVFIQGLTGLLAKIQFPTVENLLMGQRWKILKAELVFEPLMNSYDLFRLPQRLFMWDTDKGNRFSLNSYMRDAEGNPVFPEFEYDQFYNEDTRYTFEITNFINRELSDFYFDYEHGLLIGLEQSKFLSALDRLVIEGKNPPVKLRIYYLTY